MMEAPHMVQDWAQAPGTPRARAQSRSSGSTNPNRSARESLMINTSTQHRSVSPPIKTPSTPSQSYRSRHGGCKPMVPSSLGPRQSTETVETQRQPQAPVSSFLMEKLRQERLVEGEKLASRTSVDMSSSLELGVAPASPARIASPADGRRPRSSESGEPQQQPAKKKGLGLKEMEQLMSKMHKQNFDLKLELFHRREKQGVLEDKIEQLSTDKERLDDQNKELEAENARRAQDSAVLANEVDKRDKAIQEAVSMIVMLESEKGALAKELSILRELAGTFLNAELDPSLASNTPRNVSPDNLTPMVAHGDRAVNRMPSFVSQASQRTENLRDVWLGTQTTDQHPPLPSLRAVSGVSRIEMEPLGLLSSEVDHPQGNRLSSPSLSDLSESSFQSVYGPKYPEDDDDDDQDAPDHDTGEGSDRQYLMGEDASRTAARMDPAPTRSLGVLETPKHRIATPTRISQLQYGDQADRPKDASQPRNSQFTSITDIIGHGSPFTTSQRSLATTNSGGSSSAKLQQSQVPVPVAASRSGTRTTREDKRDSLRRVVVDTRLTHDQGLPPTPDTISTTTLSGFKHSDDVLMAARAQQQSLVGRDGGGVSLASARRGTIPTTPLVRHDDAGSGAYFDGNDGNDGNDSTSTPRRPRSASETTVSRQGDGWESGDEDASDAHSLESSLDVWLRESSESADRHGHSPYISPKSLGIDSALHVTHTQYGGEADRHARRRASPGHHMIDASGYPITASGAWDSAGSMISGEDAQLDPATAIQAALFVTGGPAPPPPGRRSSLHAKTLAKPATSPMSMPRPASTQPYRGSNKYAEFGTPSTVRHAPPPQLAQEPKRPYPPVSGPARGRLNSLFRRSMSAAPTVSSSSYNVPMSPSSRVPSPGGGQYGGGGGGTGDVIIGSVPSRGLSNWGRRGSIGEDDHATPPLIQRQRGNSISMNARALEFASEGASLASSGSGNSSMASISTISPSCRVPETPRARSPLHIAMPSRGVGLSPRMQSPSQSNTPSFNPPSVKKKWLPFGRSNSLRNRAG